MTRTDRTTAALAALALGALAATAASVAHAASVRDVSQRRRAFEPRAVEIARGDALRFVNDDGELLHHAHVPPGGPGGFAFDTGEQAPGSAVLVRFPVAGTFEVLCGIHPRMRLAVTVR